MRIKTYKTIVGSLAVLLAATVILSTFTIYSHDAKLQADKYQLVTENERLRSFNVRRERRLKWMNEPKTINLSHVAQAFHVMGTKSTVVAALLYSENGPEYIGSGSLDRSSFVSKNFPIEQWSSLEGARTLNRLAWNWILEDPKRAKSYFLYASKPYTGLSESEQRVWATNMLINEKRFREEIKDDGSDRSEDNLIMKMRTPTPTIAGQERKLKNSKTTLTRE